MGRVHRGTKRSATKALAALVAEVERGDHGRPTMTVLDVVDRYIAESRDRVKHTTLRIYESARERIDDDRLGRLEADAVRVVDVEQFLRNGQSASLARQSRNLLSAAFNDALRVELVGRNPAHLARRPQERVRKPPEVDVAKVAAAINAKKTPKWLATALHLAVSTGARRGELVALQWADIDLKAGTLCIRRNVTQSNTELHVGTTKTGKERTVAIDAGTVAVLKSWERACKEDALAFGVKLQPTTWVFPQRPDGREPIWPSTLTSAWRKLADTHDLGGVRLHDLRHAVATSLIAEGLDPRLVADRLGHSNILTTLGIYAHSRGAEDRRAADVMGRLIGGEG